MFYHYLKRILRLNLYLEIFFAAVSATLEVELGERKAKPSTLGFYLPTVNLTEDEVK